MVNKCDHAGWDEDYEILCDLLSALAADAGGFGAAQAGAEAAAAPAARTDGCDPGVLEGAGQEPELNVPFIIRRGATVEEPGGRIHKDFLHNLKSARIWGTGRSMGRW